MRLGQRIDPRSYKDQGSEKLAQKHLGRKAAALERQGIETEIGKYNRKVREHNQFLDEKAKLDSEIASLEAEIMEGHHGTAPKHPTEDAKLPHKQPSSNLKSFLNLLNAEAVDCTRDLALCDKYQNGSGCAGLHQCAYVDTGMKMTK